MIQLCSLASGSSGNCIYVGNENTHILVDAGISGKRIKAGLDSINVDPKELDGIFITHEHSDHISGLGVMARRYEMPIYTTAKTWEALRSIKSLGNIDENLIRFIQPDEPVLLNEMEILPFKTSHDATDSVCYTISYQQQKIGLVTDLGNFDDYTVRHLSGSHLLYLETNHDIKMLQAGGYPYYLKQRIMSDLGHLSNELATQLLSEIVHKDLQYVVLAHLSKENNHPDVAFLEVKYFLDQYKIKENVDVSLVVANRDIYSEAIVVE